MISKTVLWLKKVSIFPAPKHGFIPQCRFNRGNSGFTLIELLVVIAVVGVLAGAVIAIINPPAMLDRARIAKGKSFQGQLDRNLGYYTVGKWNFNSASNQGEDTSGGNNTATLAGGISYIASCDLGSGGCFSFDGVDDYLNMGTSQSLNFGNGNFSLSVWQYRTSNSGVKIILGKRVYPAGYVLYFSGNSLVMQLGNGTSASGYTVDTITSLNVWQHIAIVVSRSTNELIYYLDGTLKNKTNIAAFTGSVDNAGYFGVGRDQSDGQSFQGKLDEVLVFNQSISQAMVQRLYVRGGMKRSLALAQK